jgi:Leucine-rich repeat (LRR) protein
LIRREKKLTEEANHPPITITRDNYYHYSHEGSLKLDNLGLTNLEFLPDTLHSLSLNLFNNRLTSFTGFSENAPNLICIDVIGNKIRSFEGFHDNLPQLTELSLGKNYFTTLQGMPQYFPELQELSLNENKLINLIGLPPEIPNLLRLSLENNQLTSLKGLPSSLPNLEWIDLSKNQLKNFEHFPLHMPRLRSISAEHNQLCSLTGLPSLPDLGELHLNDNCLTTLTGFPTDLPFLHNLYLHNNQLTSLADLPPNLPYLGNIHIHGNPLQTLHGLSPQYIAALLHPFLNPNKRSALRTFATQFHPQVQFHILRLDRQEIGMFAKSPLFRRVVTHIAHMFAPTPMSICSRYCNKDPLTDFKKDRLAREGGFRERQLMENADLPFDDPILTRITERLSISTPDHRTILM